MVKLVVSFLYKRTHSQHVIYFLFNFSIQGFQTQSHFSLQATIFLLFVSTPSLPLQRYVCKAQFLSAHSEFFAKGKGKEHKLKEYPPYENTNTPTPDIYDSLRLLVSVLS